MTNKRTDNYILCTKCETNPCECNMTNKELLEEKDKVLDFLIRSHAHDIEEYKKQLEEVIKKGIPCRSTTIVDDGDFLICKENVEELKRLIK